MRANPGGEIDPADVLGRDALIQALWRVLSRQSLELTAERRIGKSSIIKKMAAEPPPAHLAIYQDLEGIRTRLEFVEAVYGQVAALLSKRRQRADRLQKLLTSLSGVEIRGLSLPRAMAPQWKPLLQAVAEDLEEHLEGTLVFFWDELPFMLQNIQVTEGVEAAREVLDVLRGIRQTRRSLRMVYTGSIGLHHVLDDLRSQTQIAQAPMNDMDRVEVPPLEVADASELARRILAGEGLACPDPAATAAALAEAVDGIAYYVHLVLDGLIKTGQEASPATVRAHVQARIHDPTDPWHLTHFHQRLQPYYGSRAPLAVALLDAIAGATAPVDRQTLIHVVEAKFAGLGREDVQSMLALLVRDHYLIADVHGRCRFCYAVVRRWWAFHRLLGAAAEAD